MKKEEITLKEKVGIMSKKFLELSRDKDVLVLSHFDTDGITSAAIMIKTLKHLGKNFSVKILKNLEEQHIRDLPKNKLIIFLDLASGSLNYIANSKIENIFILDHHEIVQDIPENVCMLNPQLHKKEKISSAGLTYLFCRELAHTIHGLAKLAVIGMIGDMMEKNLDKINNKILEESEAIKKRGLLIYPATRPLNRTLEFSSNPYIPGVTGDSYGVTKLLRDAGLTHKEGKYPSLIELNPDEMSNLITSIMLRHPKITNNTDIIGDIFLVKFFNKLEDARELSAMINACSRLGESQVALQFCLEIPSAKKRAEVLYAKYKRLIISGLDLVSKIQKVEGGGFVIINTKSGVKDTIVGTIASILSNSKVYEPGTIIVTMAYSGNKIKVSARSVSRQGRNVRNVLHGVVSKIGGEVGGHEFAAGCLINKDKEEEFIKNLKENLEIELVKI